MDVCSSADAKGFSEIKILYIILNKDSLKSFWSKVSEQTAFKRFPECGISNITVGSEVQFLYKNNDNEEKEKIQMRMTWILQVCKIF